jgi:hypothetical protein
MRLRRAKEDSHICLQSERRDLYNQHLSTLLEVCLSIQLPRYRSSVSSSVSSQTFPQNDKAYHCFCSPDELSEIRKAQQAKKATASYDGRCRHLTEEDVARRKRAGHKFVVRFKVGRALVCGITFLLELISEVHGRILEMMPICPLT